MWLTRFRGISHGCSTDQIPRSRFSARTPKNVMAANPPRMMAIRISPRMKSPLTSRVNAASIRASSPERPRDQDPVARACRRDLPLGAAMAEEVAGTRRLRQLQDFDPWFAFAVKDDDPGPILCPRGRGRRRRVRSSIEFVASGQVVASGNMMQNSGLMVAVGLRVEKGPPVPDFGIRRPQMGRPPHVLAGGRKVSSGRQKVAANASRNGTPGWRGPTCGCRRRPRT